MPRKITKGHLGRLLIFSLVVVLLTTTAYSAGRYSQISGWLLDDVQIVVDGQPQQLQQGSTTVYPISYKGITYLPMRTTAQLLGYDVSWSEKTRTVDLTKSSDAFDGQGYGSLSAIAYSAASSIRDRDYRALSTIVHPTKGLRVSFNGEVVKATDVVLTASALANGQFKDKRYTWGVLDGSPEPYTVTFNTLLGKGARDFEGADRTGWNQRVTTKGVKDLPKASIKTLEGSGSLYANAEFVEYYYEGNPALEFDWYSDVFIFEIVNGKYYLVGILLNYWLI